MAGYSLGTQIKASVPMIKALRREIMIVLIESRYQPDASNGSLSLACSETPAGRNKWTLRLLADKMVELNIVDSISYGTVRNVLKKHPQALAE